MYCSALVPLLFFLFLSFSPFCFHLVVEPCSRACKNIVDNMKLISPLGTLSPLLLWLTKVKFTHALKFITGYRSGVCVHMNIGCVCVGPVGFWRTFVWGHWLSGLLAGGCMNKQVSEPKAIRDRLAISHNRKNRKQQ